MELDSTHNAANLFFTQARRLGDRPRFMVSLPEGGWQPVTWSELALRVERLAAFLIGRGVDRDAKVALLGNTRLEWAVAALGLMAARGTLVPVYPTMTSKQLTHVVGHSDSVVLLVETAEQMQRVLRAWEHLADQVHTVLTVEPMDLPALIGGLVGCTVDSAQLSERTFALQQAEALGAEALVEDPDLVQRRVAEIELSDVAYLVYTSGTTGLPKGVPLTHANVGASGVDWFSCNGELVREGDVDLLWLPMSHLYGMGELFLGNQAGFVTYLSDPLRVLPHLPEVRPHVFMSVPAYWEKLMQLAQAAGDDPVAQRQRLAALTGGRLRFCLSGGAGLARPVKDFFLAADVLIIEGYGLTECSPNLTFNRKDDFDFDTVGKACPSVELRLADDGEILARGPNVFAGYFKDPEATAAILDAEGWLHTGDLGRFTDEGFLQIIGRKKEILVTSGGKNIPPVNIEQRFKDDPLFAQIMVYGDGKKFLTALVDINDAVVVARLSADPGGEAYEGSPRRHPQVYRWVEERIAAVNAELAPYETIKKFWIVSSPLTVEGDMLTPTLKLKRTRICERYRGQLESLYE